MDQPLPPMHPNGPPIGPPGMGVPGGPPPGGPPGGAGPGGDGFPPPTPNPADFPPLGDLPPPTSQPSAQPPSASPDFQSNSGERQFSFLMVTLGNLNAPFGVEDRMILKIWQGKDISLCGHGKIADVF